MTPYRAGRILAAAEQRLGEPMTENQKIDALLAESEDLGSSEEARRLVAEAQRWERISTNGQVD